MSFSKRFKELREKKGMSQEAVSKELKIPRSTITHYENDFKRLPRQERLKQIADFFGVSVDYLIGHSNNNKLNEAEMNFLSDIDNLSIEELKTKHILTVDGKKASTEEIEGAIAFIRSLRNLK